MTKSSTWIATGIGITSLAIFLVTALLAPSFVERKTIAAIEDSLAADLEDGSVQFHFLSGKAQLNNLRLVPRSVDASWQEATLDQARITYSPLGLLFGLVPVDVSIGQLQIKGDPSQAAQWLTPALAVARPGGMQQAWPAWQIRSLSVESCSPRNSDAWGITGLQMTSGDASIQSCRINAHLVEDIHARYRFQKPVFRLESLEGMMGAGTFDLSGHWDTSSSPGDLVLDYTFTDLPVEFFLSSLWKPRISGRATGQGRYQGQNLDWQTGQAQAQVRLTDASIQFFPFLETLARLRGLSNLTRVPLDTARSKIRFSQGRFDLTEIEIAREDAFSWEGHLTIFPDQRLDGDTRLGVSETWLAPAPRLKKEVFTDPSGSLHYTPVQIRGTVPDPEEDLSPRIQKALSSDARDLLQRGEEFIEEGIEKAREFIDQWMKKTD